MLEPWGFGVDDLRFGLLSSTVASVFGGSVPYRNFMFRPPPEEETVVEEDDTIEKLKLLFKPQASTSPAKL